MHGQTVQKVYSSFLNSYFIKSDGSLWVSGSMNPFFPTWEDGRWFPEKVIDSDVAEISILGGASDFAVLVRKTDQSLWGIGQGNLLGLNYASGDITTLSTLTQIESSGVTMTSRW